MTTLTALQKHQRLERRRSAEGTADGRRFRIIVLPASGQGAAIHQIGGAPSLLRATPDDLDQVTWEDAEWQ